MLPDHFSPLSVDIKLFVLALDVLVVLAQTAPGKQNHGEEGKGSEDGILTTESLENMCGSEESPWGWRRSDEGLIMNFLP